MVSALPYICPLPLLISEVDAPRTTRAQKGAEAAKEILAAPRGIDARSLAAKPPGGFTISRVDTGPSQQGRGGFVPRGRNGFSGNRGGPGGFTPRNRGPGGTGTSSRAGRAGGARGARGAGGRGRGRGDRGKRPRGPRPKTEEADDVDEPFNEEELAWMAGDASGWASSYVPKTSLEQLLGKGLTAMGSPRGTLEAAMYKVQVGTNNINGERKHSEEHLANMNKGNGSFFETAEAKVVTQQYLNDTREKKGLKPLEIPILPETERKKLSEAWIAGHYVGPKPAEKGDVLGQVDVYAKLNETYLPEDARKLQAKLATLLPVAAPKTAAARPSQKPL
jgi:hypothetical protein